LKTGLKRQPATFFYGFDNENIKKKWHMHDRLSLFAAILAQWWHLVAF
jgi:hypothetical protein